MAVHVCRQSTVAANVYLGINDCHKCIHVGDQRWLHMCPVLWWLQILIMF